MQCASQYLAIVNFFRLLFVRGMYREIMRCFPRSCGLHPAYRYSSHGTGLVQQPIPPGFEFPGGHVRSSWDIWSFVQLVKTSTV